MNRAATLTAHYYEFWRKPGFFVALLLTLFLTNIAKADNLEDTALQPIPFVITPDVLAGYQKFMGGRRINEVLDIDDQLARDGLEVFTTLYVLTASGLNYYPEFVTTPSLERHIALLKTGGAAMSAALIDIADLKNIEDIEAISSLSEKRTRLVGLYTSPGNERALSALNRNDISKLTAISNKSWHADWKALQNVDLAGLVSVADWNTMCRMVVAGRVDFLLAPKRRGNILETPVGSLTLMHPFAVKIQAARKFALSKKHPQTHRIKAALLKGLRAIGPNHFIQDAFRQLDPENGLAEMLIILNE